MDTAVLLMAYGSPDSLDDIEPYLLNVRGGRKSPPELVEKIRERYALIGGRSPLLDITCAQARALEERLNSQGNGSQYQYLRKPVRGAGFPACRQPRKAAPHARFPTTEYRVYVGMRHWRPYIREAVAQIVEDGLRDVVALCMTPHYSRMSVGAYFQKLQEAQAELGVDLNVAYVKSWHDHPLFLQAIADKVRAALDRFPTAERDQVKLLFTAHSLPAAVVEQGDPYDWQVRETARAVVDLMNDAALCRSKFVESPGKVGVEALARSRQIPAEASTPEPFSDRLPAPTRRSASGVDWQFCYQSAPASGIKWLGPQIENVVVELAEAGHRNILVVPIGFVADHVEILYDIDIAVRGLAEAAGARLERTESMNVTPMFIDALADITQHAIRSTWPSHSIPSE